MIARHPSTTRRNRGSRRVVAEPARAAELRDSAGVGRARLASAPGSGLTRARRTDTSASEDDDDSADPDHSRDPQEAEAAGQRAGVRHRLHGPHVRRRLPGREGLVRPADRALRPDPLEPAAAVLHYAQAIFDGLKAFRGKDGRVRLFRPQKHVERMSLSARRLCIPELDPELGLQSLVELVRLEQDWVPSSVGTALYLRPTIIASEPFLGRPAREAVPLLRDPVAGRCVLQGRDEPGQDPRRGQVRPRGGRRDGRRQDRRQLRGKPARGRGGACGRLHAGAVAGRRAAEVRRRGGHHEHHDADRRRGPDAAA